MNIDTETFPSILLACLGLELWAKRHANALRVCFAVIDNTDRGAVVVRVGPRGIWLRKRPKLGREFRDVDGLQLMTIEGSVRTSTTLAAFGAYVRNRSGLTPELERELAKAVGEETTNAAFAQGDD